MRWGRHSLLICHHQSCLSSLAWSVGSATHSKDPWLGQTTNDIQRISFGYRPWRWYWGVTEVWKIYIWTGELRGIVGEERRGQEMDGCPLTLLPPLQCVVSQHTKTARRLPGPL
jgi:hypothetical protein